MTTAAPAAPTGIFGLIGRMGQTFFALVRNRAELVTVELHEEQGRAMRTLEWYGLMMLMAFMAMITLTSLLVVAFWNEAFWVLLGLSAFYFGVAAAGFLVIRQRLKRPFLPESLAQIRKDCECFSQK